MATSVDICNLALGMLGDSARVTSISPADGSPNAAHCARWYPIALRKILEEHDWSFAIRRARGSSIDDLDASLYERKYAYLLPADCVRLLRVSDAGRISYPCEYDVELYKTNSDSRAVFTDAENAVLTYVSYCDAPSVFPSSFTQALVILLAAYLVVRSSVWTARVTRLYGFSNSMSQPFRRPRRRTPRPQSIIRRLSGWLIAFVRG